MLKKTNLYSEIIVDYIQIAKVVQIISLLPSLSFPIVWFSMLTFVLVCWMLELTFVYFCPALMTSC